MNRRFTVFIPRNDLRKPRETSSLSPVRNTESLSRSWIGVQQTASAALALVNKTSQAIVQAQRAPLPGFQAQSASLFTVISDGGDFMVCYQNTSNSDVGFTPATSGNQVNVYKPWKLRVSLSSETINGVIFNYTYAPTGSPVSFYTRNWTGSDSSSGSDYVIPFYLPNDPVWATQDAKQNWVDTNRDGRAWATFQQSP